MFLFQFLFVASFEGPRETPTGNLYDGCGQINALSFAANHVTAHATKIKVIASIVVHINICKLHDKTFDELEAHATAGMRCKGKRIKQIGIRNEFHCFHSSPTLHLSAK